MSKTIKLFSIHLNEYKKTLESNKNLRKKFHITYDYKRLKD